MSQHRLQHLLPPVAMQKVSAFVVLLTLCVAAPLQAQEKPNSGGSWKFAVSGDSRNCGDIVMPAIARGVLHDGAAFYWHLGDYRRMTTVDEDYLRIHPYATMGDYLASAWPDFIQHQLKPFGDLPIFLTIGNHELVKPKTRPQYIEQFADWLDQPVIKRQRLADNPEDHVVRSYYHWIDRGIDFISMDNGSADMFDGAQMAWVRMVLANAAKDSSVRTVVVGMHSTFPEGLSTGHSMNDTPTQHATGRQVYAQLVEFRRSTGKHVYVLGSHSHFVLNNVYETSCNGKDRVLPGWIIGGAGAVRYRLPKDHTVATVAKTDVYGYLLATVAPDDTITFEFKQVNERDVPAGVVEQFSRKLVDWCFAENKSDFTPAGPACP
ncbi:MAG: metallophosphoesterase [Candidatus Korobacteraceae bacterium]